MEQLGLKLAPIWGAGVPGGALSSCATMLAPVEFLFWKKFPCWVTTMMLFVVALMELVVQRRSQAQ